jgi:hypothetical protein
MTNDDAELILNWYLELERRLCGFLQTIPFNTPNVKITLPPLANIIVDAGSLVDTIFREEFPSGVQARDKLKIFHFAPHYEKTLQLSTLKAVLYQYPFSYLTPFAGWVNSATGKYAPLQWWEDYNKLKHERVREYSRSTLGAAINTVGALFQVLARMDVFFDALLRHDMIDLNGISIDGPLRNILDLMQSRKTLHSILIESELFAITRGCRVFPNDISKLNPRSYGGKKLWRYAGRHSV